eukprot:NODE_138_length_17968_cov_0.291175.p5 type:complete len:309 gc:universal NODE_138_length_17968_cov_0.291175:13230-12304(-)
MDVEFLILVGMLSLTLIISCFGLVLLYVKLRNISNMNEKEIFEIKYHLVQLNSSISSLHTTSVDSDKSNNVTTPQTAKSTDSLHSQHTKRASKSRNAFKMRHRKVEVEESSNRKKSYHKRDNFEKDDIRSLNISSASRKSRSRPYRGKPLLEDVNSVEESFNDESSFKIKAEAVTKIDKIAEKASKSRAPRDSKIQLSTPDDAYFSAELKSNLKKDYKAATHYLESEDTTNLTRYPPHPDDIYDVNPDSPIESYRSTPVSIYDNNVKRSVISSVVMSNRPDSVFSDVDQDQIRELQRITSIHPLSQKI